MYQALPDDPTFKQRDNKYVIAAYKKICGEFGIDPSTDFRFTHGNNNGFGTVYIWVTYSGPEATDYHYPDPDLAMFDDERQTDITKDDYKANGIYYEETIKAQINSLSILCQTIRKG